MILPLLSYEEVIGSENDNSLKEVLWCSAVIILFKIADLASYFCCVCGQCVQVDLKQFEVFPRHKIFSQGFLKHLYRSLKL